MSWRKWLLAAALVALLACTRGQSPKAAAPAWTVTPSEAFDALMLVNAISTDAHYSQNYSGLRSVWASRLGSGGLADADAIFGTVSLSGAVRLLYPLKPEKLGDLIAAFAQYDKTRARIEQSLAARGGPTEYERQDLQGLERRRREFLEYLTALQRAGYSEDWRKTCLPAVEKQAAELRTSLAELPDADTERTLTRFLGCPRTPVRGIVLLYYASPIAFQLPDGFMASEALEPAGASLSNIPVLGRFVAHFQTKAKARRFAAIALHESLHGFPRSAEAIALQDALIAKSPALTSEYTALTTQWHEGPEEYAVVAAEAYLSEVLGIRSRREAERYIERENGGMTFSMTIFTALEDRKPDTLPQFWTGYGDWLVASMRDGVVR